jgi:hypothetical protein
LVVGWVASESMGVRMSTNVMGKAALEIALVGVCRLLYDLCVVVRKRRVTMK